MNSFPAEAISRSRVLVVGDVMLDRYWFGEVERISPEAPVPVVRVARREDRLGGAANVARNIAALRAGLPSPRMVDFDRYALRAFVLVALIASVFVAGPEKYARIASAFDWRGVAGEEAGYRVDAWIDPPNYTGKPPILLKLAANGIDAKHPQKMAVPIGSTVIVRTSGGDLKIDATSGLVPPKAADKTADKSAAKTPSIKKADDPAPDQHERRLVLRGDAHLEIRHSGALLGNFNLAVIPDKPPRIELTDAPRSNLRGSLTLSYKIEDDYGVVGATAEFSDPHIEGAKGHMRSLVAPPSVALALPAGPGGLGETEMTADLSDHPWAGARVRMVLKTHDEGGNEGRSDPIEITLPAKHFVKPLAAALAEQRRDLILGRTASRHDRELCAQGKRDLGVSCHAYLRATLFHLDHFEPGQPRLAGDFCLGHAAAEPQLSQLLTKPQKK